MKPGIPELIIILVVVIIIFGPTQIPKLTKMLGRSVKSFKDGIADTESGEAPEENRPPKTQAGKDAGSGDEKES